MFYDEIITCHGATKVSCHESFVLYSNWIYSQSGIIKMIQMLLVKKRFVKLGSILKPFSTLNTAPLSKIICITSRKWIIY